MDQAAGSGSRQVEVPVSGDIETDELLPDGLDPGAVGPAPLSWRRRTAVEMVVSGIIGLFASLNLSVEAWKLAQDSTSTFTCDISSVLSCSTVALTPQARVLGFPNAFLGLIFESVVLAVSVAIAAGVRFPRWYMSCVEALYTIALGFALWLFTQSYFVIQVLCPWCLLITLTTILVWSGLTRINLREGTLPAPAGVRRLIASGTDWFVVGLALVVVLGMVGLKYGPELFG